MSLYRYRLYLKGGLVSGLGVGEGLGSLAQVPLIVARVRFCAGDLLRKTAICAMQWRRSFHFFRTSTKERVTCANSSGTSAPNRVTGDISKMALSQNKGDLRQQQRNQRPNRVTGAISKMALSQKKGDLRQQDSNQAE